VYYIWWWMSSE